MNYKINEIYTCLQGEGPRLGTPSLLVRFQICNLRCPWCDTPYTHTIKSDIFKTFTLEDLGFEIVSRIGKCRNIIFSGGEPTLYNLVALKLHLSFLLPDLTYEVETNGTQIPHEKFKEIASEDYASFQWNVSPKGSNAGEIWNERALAHWSALSCKIPGVFFKFVVREAQFENDIGEVKQFIEKFSPKEGSLLVMCEGTSKESQCSASWLEKVCIEYGWKYSPRLHVVLHGTKRGV